MIYPYKCVKCDHVFDVIKSYKDIDRNEWCDHCEAPAERQFTARVHFIGAKVEHAEYNPGLGQVVKNRREREEIAKRKGLIEVGNEKVETLDKVTEQTREERRRKRWEDD